MVSLKFMLLSIVIINYKRVELTLKCVESLFKKFKNEFKENIFELIIVDNASGDDSVQILRQKILNEKYRNIIIVENDDNLGFSLGCNLGAKEAKGDLILFLNNDTEVKDKGILEMTKFLNENNDIAILGGLLSNSDGSSQPSVGKFYTFFNTFLLLMGLQRADLINKNPFIISEVDWVKGACMMIKESIFKKIGGFDEKIFMYTEDMELCYRAKQAGYKTFFFPNISILHDEHGSANRSFAIINIYKGILYFYKKHKSKFEYEIVKMLLIAKAWVAIVIGMIIRSNYLVSTYKQATRI